MTSAPEKPKPDAKPAVPPTADAEVEARLQEAFEWTLRQYPQTFRDLDK